MKLNEQLSDDAILAEIGQRLARRRLDLGLTQADLAEQAGVGKRTLERLEAGATTQLTTWVRVLRVLGLLAALDQALPPAGPRPLDFIHRGGKPRQRAAGSRSKAAAKTWSWAEE